MLGELVHSAKSTMSPPTLMIAARYLRHMVGGHLDNSPTANPAPRRVTVIGTSTPIRFDLGLQIQLHSALSA